MAGKGLTASSTPRWFPGSTARPRGRRPNALTEPSEVHREIMSKHPETIRLETFFATTSLYGRARQGVDALLLARAGELAPKSEAPYSRTGLNWTALFARSDSERGLSWLVYHTAVTPSIGIAPSLMDQSARVQSVPKAK